MLRPNPPARLAFSTSLSVSRAPISAFISNSACRALSPRFARRSCFSPFSSSSAPTSSTAILNHRDDPDTESASQNGVALTAKEFDQASIIDDDEDVFGNDLNLDALLDDSLRAASDTKQSDSPQKNVDKTAISNFRLSPETISRLSKNNIANFTEVQAGTFDLIYDGKDVIAKSRTGTGKTLAFSLPIIERLAQSAKGSARRGQPRCIVLAPTRELAKQVAREMTHIGSGLGLSVECFYGGSSYTTQENALRRGLDVLVGTPGRIMDHLDRGNLHMSSVEFAVLDEADEMLSMGFAQDVERIFEGLPPTEERQVILFSATVPSWVKGLAAQFQRPDVVTFDAVTTGSMAATTVRHCAVRVPEREEARAGLLADIIAVHSSAKAQKQLERQVEDKSNENSDEVVESFDDFDDLIHNSNFSSDSADAPESIGPSRAIVFTETKREADELATSGALDGCGAAVLHGDVSQRQREITLAQFRKGQLQVLVATDVAARGLDISGVDVVVQYRVPRESESYIHRAGRTGRAGKSGTAVVMYSDREAGHLSMLERQCRIKFVHEAAPAPELALDAAVDLALANVRSVEPRIRKHLSSRAERIVDLHLGPTSDEDDMEEPGSEESEERRQRQVDLVAGLLAMAGRRTTLADRSVLSGESGKRTLLVQKRDGTGDHSNDDGRHGRGRMEQHNGDEIAVGKAMRFINEVGTMAELDGRLDIGLIRTCRDGSAVVDVSSAYADKLLEAWTEMEESGQLMRFDVTLSLATKLPALKQQTQRRDNFRGGRRDRRPGGGGGGWRDRDQRRGGYSSYGGRDGGEWRRNDRGGGDRYRGGRDRSHDRRNDRFGNNNGYFGRGGRGGGGGGRGGGGGGQNRRGTNFLDNDF